MCSNRIIISSFVNGVHRGNHCPFTNRLRTGKVMNSQNADDLGFGRTAAGKVKTKMEVV